MSLDVYLYEKVIPKKCWCPTCGHEHDGSDETELYWANITHNLNKMAKEADLYLPVWKPEEVGIEYARDLIPHLERGLTLLRGAPDHFKQWNPPNGWGDYDGFVVWLERYRQACREYPGARIHVSR